MKVGDIIQIIEVFGMWLVRKPEYGTAAVYKKLPPDAIAEVVSVNVENDTMWIWLPCINMFTQTNQGTHYGWFKKISK